MSVPAVGSNGSQSVQSLLLQQLMASQGGQPSTLPDALSDLLNLSPAARQLSQAPAAVTQAMGDLLTAQKDVQGDLAKLKAYFQDHPQSLTSLLGTLQGGATYAPSGAVGGNGAMLAALMKGQANNPKAGALLSAFLGMQNQNPLLASLSDSDTGSGNSAFSLLG